MNKTHEKTPKATPNPYANNRGGRILAPHPATEEPKAVKTVGNDLRTGK